MGLIAWLITQQVWAEPMSWFLIVIAGTKYVLLDW